MSVWLEESDEVIITALDIYAEGAEESAAAEAEREKKNRRMSRRSSRKAG